VASAAPPAPRPGRSILILGPLAPPVGGVAVHVQRVAERLRAMGWRVDIRNHASARHQAAESDLRRNPLRYWLAVRRAPVVDVLHYHHSRWSTLLAVAVGRSSRHGARFVVTVHGPRAFSAWWLRLPPLPRATRWALDRFDQVIAVSPEVAAGLRTRRPVTILPAFLPPTEQEVSLTALDPATDGFLEEAAPALVVMAYRIASRGARDLYGLDTAARAFERLAPRHAGMRLLLLLAQPPRGPRRRAYVRALVDRARRAAGEDRVRVAVGGSLLAALRHDAILVRPSRSDGDAVSVREALALGVPVVASDAASRPVGVAVVPVDDAEALADAIERVAVARRPRSNGRAGDDHGFEALRRLMDVYGGERTPR
jgi:glycogen synthase